MVVMRRASFALILLPLLSVAATCVSRMEQRGPAGPWVGEVRNLGEERANHIFVSGRVVDADGRPVPWGDVAIGTCPESIPPGGRAWFLVGGPGASAGYRLPYRLDGVRSQAEVMGETGYKEEGLSVTVLARDFVSNRVVVELANRSHFWYQRPIVCALAADGSGAPVSFGMGSPSLFNLAPGDKRRFTIDFSGPLTSQVDFVAQAIRPLRPEGTIDPRLLRLVAVRVIEEQGRPYVYALGELENSGLTYLGGLSLSAHIEEDPWALRWAEIGCGGRIGPGERGAALIVFELKKKVSRPTVVVQGVDVWSAGPPVKLVVSNLRWREGAIGDFGLPRVSVEFRVTNPTNEWLELPGVCVYLRDAQGRIAGLAKVSAESPYVGPRASLALAGEVHPMLRYATVDVIAEGDLSEPPPPPPPSIPPPQ